MSGMNFAALLRHLLGTATNYSIVLAAIVTITSIARADDAKRSNGDSFFPMAGAKDCVFDQKRERLYVTTLKQLVVLDTKDGKVIEEIDLLGGVRACDISPDFQFLAVAPTQGHFIYWIELDKLEINQVTFEADASESGVFDLCVGYDNSVLFSMTYAGSGWVQLRRFLPESKSVEKAGNIRMDSLVSASGDRRYAAVAEGNISSGPLNLYDFQSKSLKKIADLDCFYYEIACAPDAKYFARPHRSGCGFYDSKGTSLGNLEGKPVICAAFHPKGNTLFVMRDGESGLQEYDMQGNSLAANYRFDSAVAIRGTVNERIIAQAVPVGPNGAMVNVRRVADVHFSAFKSGRLRVSDDGEKLFAVTPTGVYMFSVKSTAPSPGDGKPKRRINVIDGSSGAGKSG